jgi:hypothetical protein
MAALANVASAGPAFLKPGENARNNVVEIKNPAVGFARL